MPNDPFDQFPVASNFGAQADSPAVADRKGQGLSGEAYLHAVVPEAQHGIVRGLVEGRSPYPAGFLMKSPIGQRLAQWASGYDDQFDASVFPARQAQRKNYEGGGKQFQEMQAIGTVAGHLQNLMEKADTLHNFEGYGPANAPLNSLLHGYRELSQDPRLAMFETTKNAVTRELTKAYQGGHITDSSVNEWQKSINAAQTPEQLRGVIGNLNELLGSKRRTLEEGYKQTMGKYSKLPEEFTSENARTRKIFENVDAWSRGAKIAGGGPAPAEMQPPKPGAYVYDPKTRTLVPQ